MHSDKSRSNSKNSSSRSDRDWSGSGHSDGSSGSRRNVYENDKIDVICDEDLADVDKDISLGNYESDSDLSAGSSEKGYIDDAIVQDVMKSADERLNERNGKYNKIVIVCVVGATAFLAIVIGLVSHTVGNNSFEKEMIEKIIEDTTSAFKFDDSAKYAGSSKNESIWDKQIPLEDGIVFPPVIENYLVDPRLQKFDANQETPMFWQVPLAGGVFQKFMTSCSKKVLASNHRLADGDTLQIYTEQQNKYVNVDLSTTEGIENAAEQGLIESGLADVIVSNHLHFATSSLLGSRHKGRLFTAVRHPVDRSISEYHFVVSTSNDFFVRNMSLEEFVSSRFIDKDWMTRFLVNKRHESLTKKDLQLAKEILRRRCLVGLHEHIELSINLFEQYFGWTAKEIRIAEHAHDSCKHEIMRREKSHARNVYELVGNVKQDGAIYKKIVQLNKFDMELYWYAYTLFEEQLSWFKANGTRL